MLSITDSERNTKEPYMNYEIALRELLVTLSRELQKNPRWRLIRSYTCVLVIDRRLWLNSTF